MSQLKASILTSKEEELTKPLDSSLDLQSCLWHLENILNSEEEDFDMIILSKENSWQATMYTRMVHQQAENLRKGEPQLNGVREVVKGEPPDEDYLKHSARRCWDKYPSARRPVRIANSYFSAFNKYCQNDNTKADSIEHGIDLWLKSKEWAKNEGEYIPNIDKFVEEKRFLDMPTPLRAEPKEGLSPEEQKEILMKQNGYTPAPERTGKEQVIELLKVSPQLAFTRAKQLIKRGELSSDEWEDILRLVEP